MASLILRFLRDERGATAIEYALVATIISIVIVGAASVIGTKTAAPLTAAAKGLQ